MDFSSPPRSARSTSVLPPHKLLQQIITKFHAQLEGWCPLFIPAKHRNDLTQLCWRSTQKYSAYSNIMLGNTVLIYTVLNSWECKAQYFASVWFCLGVCDFAVFIFISLNVSFTFKFLMQMV